MPIDITCSERNLLRRTIDIDEIEHIRFRLEDRDETLRNVELATTGCALLEDIGWEEDATADSYEITVDDPALMRWLRRQLDLTNGALQDDLYGLGRQEADDSPENRYLGETQDEALAKIHRNISRHRDEIAVFNSLLERRLDALTAVA
jgi:hypothetical protein